MSNESWLIGQMPHVAIPATVDQLRSSNRRPIRLPVQLIEPAAVLLDFAIIMASSVGSGVAYSQITTGVAGDIQAFAGIGFLAFVYCAAILAARKDYSAKHLLQFRRQIRSVVMTWAAVFFILLSAVFILKISSTFSRGATIAFFSTGLIGLLSLRWASSAYLARAFANGAFADRKIIVIGDQLELAASPALRSLRQCGYRPVLTFAITDREVSTGRIPPTLSRKLTEIIEAARRESVEEIFLFINWNRDRCIEAILNFLSVLPIPVRLVPDHNVAHFFQNRMLSIGNTWATELRRAPLSYWECTVKRLVDVSLALIALITLAPLMTIIGILIRLDSPGPILFRQTRNGFNGKSFAIFKFRSMRVLEDGPVIRQATKDDPRVTKIGHVLRRTNLDELPQLLNVLRGDMSLVGPRPHAAAHNNDYDQRIATYAFRHHVKPGITGWAQIKGYRGETKTLDLMEKRVSLDLWYINHWSIWLDVTILLRTLFVGLQRSAY